MTGALFVLGQCPLVHELVIAQDPTSNVRTASLCLWDKGRLYLLKFANPQPLSALTEAFDCYKVRVIDQNATTSRQLEFGRYLVQFWDEDHPVSEVTADEFTYEVSYPVPRAN